MCLGGTLAHYPNSINTPTRPGTWRASRPNNGGPLCLTHTHTHAYRRCAGSLWLVVLFGHKGKKNIGFHIRVTKQHAKPQLFSFLNCKKRLAYVTHTCSTVVHTGLWPLAKSIECCTIKEANQGYSHSREETLPAITASFIHIIFDTWILKIGPM